MIIGIGTDIVDIRRIANSLQQYPERFPQRILSTREYQLFISRQQQSASAATAYLARRFAAKEAVAKALGSGFNEGIRFQDIEILNNHLGRPCLELYQKARRRAEQLGMQHSHISLSDEQHYVVAFAVLED